MRSTNCLVIVLILGAWASTYNIAANGQTAAAANYGSFTVGGSSSSYYAVQFVNNVTSYGAPNNPNTCDLVIYRPNTHDNGLWYGTFNLEVSFHPTNYGHFYGQIEKVIYQTGIGSPYNDPVGDITDGSSQSGGSDLIVWLRGGGTYYWRNRETTAGWSLANGNAAAGTIADSSGIARNPIAAQSSLVVNAKNSFYVNALGIGTPNGLHVGGNVGIGTTGPRARLEIKGNLMLTNDTSTGGTITFPDGSIQSTAYTGVVCGGDYAESVDVFGSRKDYEPGDVLVISTGKGSDVTKSSEPYSALVVGVYSTKPGTVGRRQTIDAKTSTTEVPMAMIGIVPIKVSAENGPIRRGDLLVTSSTPGFAMKGTDRSLLTGAVIGKALGSLDSEKGVIEVVVTLQ